MTIDDFVRMIDALTRLASAVVWPLLVVFSSASLRACHQGVL